LKALHLDVEADGLMRVATDGAANAQVALTVDVDAFMRAFVDAVR
jgi:hypothetical protein